MDILELAIQEIRRRLPDMTLLLDEPMSAHCSFRIGGPAAAMALPEGAQETAELCRLLRELGERPFVMGNGTNLLIPDRPFRHIVLKMGEPQSHIVQTGGDELTAECGVTLSRLAGTARDAGLAGLEFAHGIPGTLGGGVYMNAGAYGGEMKDVVWETEYLDESLTPKSVLGERHEFSYRRSIFTDTDKIILKSRLRLTLADPSEITGRMQALSEKRRASQPLEKPSAGSTFKRPAGGYAAALIDQAGLKGFAIGGAQVSEKHAGFVVNRGGATYSDVLRLMSHIRETVYRSSGILLEPEVKIIAQEGEKLWNF